MADKIHSMNRKINLPEYICPFTGHSSGGDENCDHDYDPDSRKETVYLAMWTCTKCGMVRSYEVYD